MKGGLAPGENTLKVSTCVIRTSLLHGKILASKLPDQTVWSKKNAVH